VSISSYNFVDVYILYEACRQTSDSILRDPKRSRPKEAYEAFCVMSIGVVYFRMLIF